jgi:alkylation response protein AidB-like acyl-CoA dehydrogenase
MGSRGTTEAAPVERAAVVAEVISAESDAIHRGGCLTPAAHEEMVGANLFRACGPTELGGDECGLRAGTEIARILGRADVSTGWLFVQASATIYNFGPRLDPETATEVYPGPESVVAAGFPDGECRADVVDGGYMVSGRWNFASGCLHSAWFDARAVVYDHGERVTTRNGLFALMSCLVPRDAVTIVDTWDVAGMRGTGSQTYSTRDTFVPARRAVPMWAMATAGRNAFRVPAITFAHVQFAGLALGGAQAAYDAFEELARTKTAAQSRSALRDQGTTQSALARSHAELRAASAYQQWVIDLLTDAAATEAGVTVADRAEARLAVTAIMDSALRVAERLYRVAGTTGIFTSSPLHRCFQDLHVMSQQLFARPFHYENVGRFLLGLEHDRGIM